MSHLPLLVLLHGFTGSPASWEPVLAHLPAGTETFAPALAGHSPETLRAAERFEEEVDRLAAEIRRAAGRRDDGEGGEPRPVRLAGYSLGGRLALGLVVSHGGLFAEATLLGAHPGLQTEEERAARRAEDEALAAFAEARGTAAFVEAWESRPLFAGQKCLDPEILAAQRRQRLAHRPEGLALALRALGLGSMPSYRWALGSLRLPVRLAAGALDEKFTRLARRTAAELPRGSFHPVPEAGHNVILEAPRAVAALLAGDPTP